MFRIEFYETADGKTPVEDFLESLDSKMNAKMVGLMEILEEKGNALREPYSALVTDGLFELRCKLGNNISRAIYFFYFGKKIVITNGFVKKTRRTPPVEIETAKKRRADWIARQVETRENDLEDSGRGDSHDA